MQTAHIRSIAVAAAGTNEEYQSSVLSGIADETKAQQINTACFVSFGGVLGNNLSDEGENCIYKLMNLRKFDGAVLMTNTVMDPIARAEITKAVMQAGIPAVVLDDSSNPAFYNICIDNEKAMREIVEHVVTVHNAKTLCYISGPPDNPEANSRYQAFLSVMKAHGLPADREQIYFGDFRPVSGKEAAEALLRSGQPLPDAIICANDAMALEAIAGLRKKGIRVPQDVIVTGFDNTYYAQHYNPSLSSVARPLYETGRMAVRMLMQILDGTPCEKTVTLDTSLALRESCGCFSGRDMDFKEYRESVYELIQRTRADVSLFDRMISALTGIDTTEDNVRLLGKYMQELGCEECSICLCENWQRAFRADEAEPHTDGYTEIMSAPYVRTEHGSGSVESFRSADMYPVPPADGGNISYFLPLHFREQSLGYYIITNGDFPLRSMLCHTYMLGISQSFENIRKLTNMNNALCELDRLYVMDQLCGIYNRNGFIRLAERSFRQCMCSGEKLMIGFIDMDGLKYVNDNFGHDDGDFALRTLADVIRECCGSRLTCARFGGDEFIVIGCGMTEEEAARFETDFHEKLKAVNEVSGKPYRVEASIGTFVTAVTPEMRLFELITEADTIMYEQKSEKRLPAIFGGDDPGETEVRTMRESGILLPVTALPSRHGIGKLGQAAYDFVDFLRGAGCHYWQVLPLSPTGYGDSPYQSCSCFAGNPYLIDFDRLAACGWLTAADYEGIQWDESPETIEYTLLYEQIMPVLRVAFHNFRKKKPAGFRKFCTQQKAWLSDYAVFMALKDLNGSRPWYEWEPALANCEKTAVAEGKKKLEEDIEFHSFVQYCFFTQWEALKKYANARGIRIIGDIPIYAAYDSAEVWAKPQLFRLDREKKPVAVAGCPPDCFSETGQLWGNPIWDWDAMAKDGYAWWLDRIAFTLNMYDTVRIDHFRGFEKYYAIPYGHETAEHGKWTKGPAFALWKAAKERFGEMNVIAEDLGNITPAVERLLKRTGFPGMKVLQFAFDSGAENPYLPHNFETANCVCYTGTHDNHTLRGWVRSNPAEVNAYAMAYLGVKKEKRLPKAMLRAAWGSTARIAVAPLQDFLNAPPSARINTPSTLGGNWVFRTSKADFTHKLKAYIRELNETYGRLNPAATEKQET